MLKLVGVLLCNCEWLCLMQFRELTLLELFRIESLQHAAFKFNRNAYCKFDSCIMISPCGDLY
jgi:hypothetical protein